MLMEDKCKDCSCLKCKHNGNKEKSCLSKETLEIMNGCMTCYLCMKYNNYSYYDNNKPCINLS
jgi:hypothetical protein